MTTCPIFYGPILLPKEASNITVITTVNITMQMVLLKEGEIQVSLNSVCGLQSVKVASTAMAGTKVSQKHHSPSNGWSPSHSAPW